MQSEILAETARRGEIHVYRYLLNRIIGVRQPPLNLANGYLVDKVRRRALGYNVADIGQILGRNRHFVSIPRHRTPAFMVLLQQGNKITEELHSMAAGVRAGKL